MLNPSSADLSQAELLRYSRHLLIPEVGLEGQRKLREASVLIVGTGGLGSPAALYLAAAGVGHIGLVDYDLVDESNLQRQVIHSTEAVDQPKVESARARMLSLNPFIQVDAINAVLTADNARSIAADYDLFLDGSDNFPTRYLMNDLAALTGKPYIYGSIFRFEGQVSVFDAQRGPCYRCLFPEPPPPGSVPTCAEGGVFGVLPGTIGTMQATEAIKLILGIGQPLIGRLLIYDALEMTVQTVNLRKNPHCKLCGSHPEVTELVDYEQFCGIPALGQLHTLPEEQEISPAALAERISGSQPLTLLDVREPVELQVSALPGAVNIPLGELSARLTELPHNAPIVAFCRTGVRSAQAVSLLQSAGFVDVVSLRGGVNAWSEQVDSRVRRY